MRSSVLRPQNKKILFLNWKINFILQNLLGPILRVFLVSRKSYGVSLRTGCIYLSVNKLFAHRLHKRYLIHTIHLCYTYHCCNLYFQLCLYKYILHFLDKRHLHILINDYQDSLHQCIYLTLKKNSRNIKKIFSL